MKKNIRSERGREERKDKILNRFLWGLGFVIIALFLAVGLKSILKPAMQEAMPIAKEMAEPQGKLAQQEKEESVFEEEFSQAPISPAAGGMKQIARASSREEREIVQNQPAFVKELEEAGIEVKEIKPAESTNKLFASNPKAITHYMKIINETKPATDTALPHVPGEILVSEITSSGTIEFSTVKVEPGTEAEAIDVLSGLPGTRAELNSLFRIFMLGYPQNDEPNDREYGKQWGLGKIGILGAWDKAKGKDASPEEVIIAILDTGADLDHPDLIGSIDTTLDHDFVNGGDVAQDDNGHGTHVAGIIGAMIDNIDGIAGIVPKPKLMILKVLDANGKQTDSNKVKEALSYALTNKAKIINMSFGGIGDWLVNINGTANQQFKAVWDTVVDSDVLLVAAAGNHGGDGAHSEDCVLYPAKYEEVLAVGGTDRDNRRWKDESPDNDGSTDSAAPGYNPWKGLKFQSAYGEKVGIAAPAGVDGPEDIYSTILDGEYGYMPGTSMAAAFVSGVAGLLLTANPYLNRDDLITIIQDNADEIDTGEVGKPIGKLINAEKAVAAALELMPAEDEIVIRGKVKNGEGEPQENIAVKMQLKNGAGEKVGEIEESELTDADGNYEIVLYTSAAASAGTLGVSALSTGTTYSVDLKAPIERDDFLTGLTPGAIYRGSENDINTSSSGGGPGGGPGDGDGPSCTFDRECAAKQPQGSIGKCIGDQCEFKTAADWNTYCQGGCGEWNNYSGEKCSDGTLHWTRWCRAGCADENDDTSRCNNTAPLADPYTQKQNNVGCETDQQCISGACYADYGERKTCHAEHKATGQRCTTDSACGRGGYCYAGSGGPETTCHTEPKNCTITGQSYSNGACRCPTGQHTENGGCVNNPASPASPTCTGNTYDSHGICCEKNTEENIGGACTAKCGTGQHRVGGECVDGDGIPDGCQGFTGDALQNCKDYCARHPTTDAERCADKVTGTTAPPCANRKARLATTGACPADDPAPPVTPPPATTTPPAGAPPAGSPAATPTPTPAAAPCNSSMCNTSLLDATEAEYNAADEAYLAAEARVNQEEDIGNNIMEINAAREAWQAALDALLEAKKAYEDAGGRI